MRAGHANTRPERRRETTEGPLCWVSAALAELDYPLTRAVLVEGEFRGPVNVPRKLKKLAFFRINDLIEALTKWIRNHLF